MKVVFPSPDSPATYMQRKLLSSLYTVIDCCHTMIVKAAPLFATILCLWLGRFAIPIGDELSGAGAIVVVIFFDLLYYESCYDRVYVRSFGVVVESLWSCFFDS